MPDDHKPPEHPPPVSRQLAGCVSKLVQVGQDVKDLADFVAIFRLSGFRATTSSVVSQPVG
jgi:hypothetical protein